MPAEGRFGRAARAHPGVLGAAAAIGLWAAVSGLGVAGRTLVASPLEVGRMLLRALPPVAHGAAPLYLHLGATLERALAGWGIVVAAGIGLGVLLGRSVPLLAASEPVVEFARAVPPVMAFPLFLVTFDFGEPAYVATIVFGCLPVMILTVAHGARGMSRDKHELLAVFAVPRATRLLATVMESLPSCVLGARITLALSLVIGVVTEMVFAPRSGLALGAFAKDAEISFDTPSFWAAIVLIGTVGWAANGALRALERRLQGTRGGRGEAARRSE